MWVYKYLLVSLLLIEGGAGGILVYPGVKLLDHTVIAMFSESTTLVSIVVAPFYSPTKGTQAVQQALGFCLFWARPPEWVWAGVSLWVCFSFPWWWVILSIYSCVYWPFVSLPSGYVYLKTCGYFLIGLVWWGRGCYCKSSFYILDNISLLSDICFINILSHSVCCLFSL